MCVFGFLEGKNNQYSELYQYPHAGRSLYRAMDQNKQIRPGLVIIFLVAGKGYSGN